MKQEVKQVNKADYIEIYNKIPIIKKRECIRFLGLIQPSNLTNRKSISIDMYNKLLMFISHYDYNSNNTIKEYLPFDPFDVQPHLSGIIGLINSIDYKLLTDVQRTKLINYHQQKQQELNYSNQISNKVMNI
jgi:hypothetical protein